MENEGKEHIALGIRAQVVQRNIVNRVRLYCCRSAMRQTIPKVSDLTQEAFIEVVSLWISLVAVLELFELLYIF